MGEKDGILWKAGVLWAAKVDDGGALSVTPSPELPDPSCSLLFNFCVIRWALIQSAFPAPFNRAT